MNRAADSFNIVQVGPHFPTRPGLQNQVVLNERQGYSFKPFVPQPSEGVGSDKAKQLLPRFSLFFLGKWALSQLAHPSCFPLLHKGKIKESPIMIWIAFFGALNSVKCRVKLFLEH